MTRAMPRDTARPMTTPPPAAKTPDLAAFCHAIPKVELHCHLLGTVRHATFKALARQASAAMIVDEIDAFYVRGDKPVGVLKALRALDTQMIKRPDDLHRIAYKYLQDAAAHNVRYAEFFWNPTGTALQSGITYPLALPAIVRAIADAQRDHGIVGRLIPAINREASPAAAREMVQWVTAHACDEVVGIGIDYSEVDHPPELFVDAYAAACAGCMVHNTDCDFNDEILPTTASFWVTLAQAYLA